MSFAAAACSIPRGGLLITWSLWACTWLHHRLLAACCYHLPCSDQCWAAAIQLGTALQLFRQAGEVSKKLLLRQTKSHLHKKLFVRKHQGFYTDLK